MVVRKLCAKGWRNDPHTTESCIDDSMISETFGWGEVALDWCSSQHRGGGVQLKDSCSSFGAQKHWIA